MGQGLWDAATSPNEQRWRRGGVLPPWTASVPASVVDGVAGFLTTIAALTQGVPAAVIVDVAARLRAVHARGGTVFVCGNGGSAAAASHLANDLGRPLRQAAAGLRAVCLNDNVAALTAWANDVGYADVFAGPLRRLARPGDALVALSVSGRSPNVVAAAAEARRLGLEVIALTGDDGGDLRALADVVVCVPHAQYGIVEAVHAALLHALSYALLELSAADGAGMLE